MYIALLLQNLSNIPTKKLILQYNVLPFRSYPVFLTNLQLELQNKKFNFVIQTHYQYSKLKKIIQLDSSLEQL